MKLRVLRIENFRAFDDVTLTINDYTCLVGPNGAGKSCVFAALNVLFRRPASRGTPATELRREDFHQRRIDRPIRITATFTDLSAEAQKDLGHYCRNGQLTLSAEAVWDAGKGHAPVRHVGTRRGVREFQGLYEASKEHKKLYVELQKQFPLPPATNKEQILAALRDFEASNPQNLVDLPSGDEFYGVVGPDGPMAKHIQWVHVPAVKDAADEEAESKSNWIGALLQRAVRGSVDFKAELDSIRTDAEKRYRDVLDQRNDVLDALSGALTRRISEWAHPDARLKLTWDSPPNKAVQVTDPFARVEAADGGFNGSLASHGHGFQRSYLLTLLQELALNGGGQATPLLLAVEEPELYQHPPQARHLANVLESLQENGVQVMVCTHSPYFISGEGFPDVRIIRRRQEGAQVAAAAVDVVQERLRTALGSPGLSLQGARSKLQQHLQPWTNELFFAPVLVLVEGQEDLAYLQAQLHVSGHATEFRRLGCHIVPGSGKSTLPVLLATATALGIPTFTMFDADVNLCRDPAECPTEEEKQKARSIAGDHKRDNRALFHLAGYEAQEPLPAATVWKPQLIAWRTNLTEVFRADFAPADFEAAKKAVRQRDGWSERPQEKSALYVGALVETLAKAGHRSHQLAEACSAILAFASAQRGSRSDGQHAQMRATDALHAAALVERPEVAAEVPAQTSTPLPAPRHPGEKAAAEDDRPR